MRISDWSSDVCSSDLIDPCPYTERKRLVSAGHEYSREHIVADLGSLPRAAVARVEDGMAHRTEHGFSVSERFEVPADHETQRSLTGALGAAGHRRGEHGIAFRLRRAGKSSRRLWRDGLRLYKKRPVREAIGEAPRHLRYAKKDGK